MSVKNTFNEFSAVVNLLGFTAIAAPFRPRMDRNNLAIVAIKRLPKSSRGHNGPARTQQYHYVPRRDFEVNRLRHRFLF